LPKPLIASTTASRPEQLSASGQSVTRAVPMPPARPARLQRVLAIRGPSPSRREIIYLQSRCHAQLPTEVSNAGHVFRARVNPAEDSTSGNHPCFSATPGAGAGTMTAQINCPAFLQASLASNAQKTSHTATSFPAAAAGFKQIAGNNEAQSDRPRVRERTELEIFPPVLPSPRRAFAAADLLTIGQADLSAQDRCSASAIAARVRSPSRNSHWGWAPPPFGWGPGGAPPPPLFEKSGWRVSHR